MSREDFGDVAAIQGFFKALWLIGGGENAAAVSGAIPLPADITAAIVGIINVGLRFVTNEGVEV